MILVSVVKINAKYMLNKSDKAMHRTAVKAFLIKFAPRKSQQIFLEQPEKPFPLDNPALMQNMTFST